MKFKNLKIWKCLRCGHVWVSNGKKLMGKKPKYCSSCHSPYWDRKRFKDMSKLELKQYKKNKSLFVNSKLPSLKIILKRMT